MTRQRVCDEFISCLRESLVLGGYDWPPLDGNIRPLKDLPGFSSINAEEIAAWLEARLDCELPHHAKLFEVKGHPLSINQIADRISEIVIAA